jgi:peptidoglycan/LPS O-acetylase OafA/YrhL
MLRRLSRMAFWVATLAAFVLATLPQPPYTPTREFGDKVEHILAFAVLTALAQLGFGAERRRAWVIGLALFGGAIELVQAIPALHRDSDWLDWLADVAAVLVVAAVLAAVARFRRRAAVA